MEGRHEEDYQCKDWARGPNPTLAGCGLNFSQVNHGSAHCSHRAVSACCLMSCFACAQPWAMCSPNSSRRSCVYWLPLGASCGAVLLDQ